MGINTGLSILNEYSTIQALELELEQKRNAFSLTCELEEARRLRLDIVLLQQENSDLQTELVHREESFELLEEAVEERDAQIRNLLESRQKLHTELLHRQKETERLQTRINALQLIEDESVRNNEEKLKLVRELNNLRPEIEHLRTQQANSTNILSEKLALQRELQTLQVELDNEKRSVQKASSKDADQATRVAKLEADLLSCKSDLAREKALREKLERGEQKADGQMAVQNAALESRLEDYRNKLKTAKDQIKSARAEAEEARKAKERLLQDKQKIPINRGKRNHAQLDADATIGTPDGFPPKRFNRASTWGERSEFPITPFLNQTTKLSIETPIDEAQEAEEEEEVEEAPPAATTNVLAKAKKVTAVRQAPKLISKPTKNIKPIMKKPLEQVEEVGEEDEEPDAIANSLEQELVTEKAAPQLPAQKKKRRMLGGGLGKTLFDDDEENTTGKIASKGDVDDFKFAISKRVKLAPKGATLLGVKGKTNATSAFGDFSPLKKDRKRA